MRRRIEVRSGMDDDPTDRGHTDAKGQAMAADPEPLRAAAWVSEGLEVLQGELDALAHRRGDGTHFDVLIIGSGYGGAVAADRLAGRQRADGRMLTVAVLERGREYLRGAFPSTFADLAGHVRFTLPRGGRARGRFEGLFDVRIGTDMSVLVANGVGGGSLINAGVMLFPDDDIWNDPAWPPAIDVADLRRRADRLRQELGAQSGGQPNTWPPPGQPMPARPAAMRRLVNENDAQPAPLTIATTAGQTSCADVALDACIGCGDCFSGCNHGAKVSLDLGLLRRAQQHGVRVVAGATVAALRRATDGPGWEVDAWHTDLALRRRMAAPLAVRAHQLILAAGSLGSTELLLRSRSDRLRLSSLLGRRFSGNGDVLAALYDTDVEFNAAADESVRPSQRGIGPTITTTLNLASDRHEDRGRCVVQDLAVPAPLRRVMEEVTTTAALLHDLGRSQRRADPPDSDGIDPLAVDSTRQRRSTVVALFTQDAACGVLHPEPPTDGRDIDADLWLDPGLRIDWPQARDDPRVQHGQDLLQQRLDRSIGGHVLPNPVWRLLPQQLAAALGAGTGPLMTVHPLGGCAMGSSRDEGVVDDLGRVFDSDPAQPPTAVHSGLHVLDGAIVARSLGVNPALTIAVLADRAIDGVIRQWQADGWLAASTSDTAPPADAGRRGRAEVRPVFSSDTDVARTSSVTEVQIVERLKGEIALDGRRFHAELSLAYAPVTLPGRNAPRNGWTLPVQADPLLSHLRLFAPLPPRAGDAPRIHDFEDRDRMRAAGGCLVEPDDDNDDGEVLVALPVRSGTLRVLHREHGDTTLRRRLHTLLAWWGNRGARDTWQSIFEGLDGGPGGGTASFLGLLTRASEVRRFDYELQLDVSEVAARKLRDLGLTCPDAGTWTLRGHKRLAYERRASPWRQLMRMRVDAFGPCRLDAGCALDVDPMYFAMLRQPLLRISRQQNLPTAYADLASFALYLLRVLVSIHLWSFRKPDTPAAGAPPRQPQRLPGELPGLPAPRVFELDPGDAKGGLLRLTRYPVPAHDAAHVPVLMIHGYSASGTTFAHEALAPSLAQTLWHDGREPWVLDLRTSAGMPTARHPWTFEEIAEADIPTAVEFVCRAAACERIDVVSHCMGSAMLAMAVLGPEHVAARVVPRIRRWVMSQITPAMLFSPDNMLRAYLLSHALHLLPQLDYPIGRAGAAGHVNVFDRFLSALPYLGDGPDSEFDVENPPPRRFWQRTPWVRTRHRLDALFGRVFDARRVPPQVLERIDDFFGEIHLATAMQTLLFARHGFVGDWRHGPEAYRRHALRQGGLERLPMPILTLHSRDNGLAHWGTAFEVRRQAAAGTWPATRWRSLMVEGAGHQDLFIGDAASEVGRAIVAFFNEQESSA